MYLIIYSPIYYIWILFIVIILNILRKYGELYYYYSFYSCELIFSKEIGKI